MIRHVLLGAALVALAGAAKWINDQAYDRGFAASEALHAEAREEQRQALSAHAEASHILTLELLRGRDERADLQRRLEHEALTDPNADRPAFGAASVFRLNQIGGH